ncbi:tryptophan-rich sensory protein [Candidatus Dependentiae bacterium]|nr:tryptophan-rich sensory protein [Candidatus Dependentiae bacterium]
MKKILNNYTFEIIGATFCLGLGMLSGYLAHSGDTIWYQSLQKPDFNPPAWIFTPIWTILYGMMGIALGKIIKIKNNANLRHLFVIQFTCNIIWSYLFFRIHRIDLALIDLIILYLALFALIIKSRKHTAIFWLLIPYFAWITFAAILNLKIYFMNA